MDKSLPDTPSADGRAWGPSSPAVAAVGLAGLLMALACMLIAADPPGRILSAIAALGLLLFALCGQTGHRTLLLQAGNKQQRRARTGNQQCSGIDQ